MCVCYGLTVVLDPILIILIVRVDVLGLCDPVQVALQVVLHLLLLTKLLEISTSLCFQSLLRELTMLIYIHTYAHTHTRAQRHGD